MHHKLVCTRLYYNAGLYQLNLKENPFIKPFHQGLNVGIFFSHIAPPHHVTVINRKEATEYAPMHVPCAWMGFMLDLQQICCIHHCVSSYLVVVLLLSNSFGEAKVADLGIVLRDQKYVPGSQVPVDKVMLLQVFHPHRHLVDQLCDVLYGCLPVDNQLLV